jgi:CheY-like chemotaxis protein
MVALGHLVGGVAHEFNNLLTSIGGFSKMALDKADQVDMVRDCLEEVILASDRAADLTRQMLAYGRKQPVETKVFAAEKILDDLERMLQPLLPVSIALSIERSEEEIFVDSDVTQITQAVLNLLLNARDAMPSGGKLTLNLSTGTMAATNGSGIDDQQSRPCAIYRVADTGTGIDDATLRQIFDPFFTTKEQGKGTGLGLSFVHAVVERSGGRITVESKIGAGTTFRIFLPQVARPSHATTADWEEFASCGGSETILVVEDERGVRNLVRSVLAECGYQVLAAADHDEAMAFLRATHTPPALLLTDVGLPGRSGPEIAEELLALMPDLKVIFMSGHTDRDGPNSHRLSAEAVLLNKPFSPPELARLIRAVLDGSPLATPAAGRSRSNGDDHDS